MTVVINMFLVIAIYTKRHTVKEGRKNVFGMEKFSVRSLELGTFDDECVVSVPDCPIVTLQAEFVTDVSLRPKFEKVRRKVSKRRI